MSRQQAIDLKIKRDREIALRAGRRLVKCDPGDEIVISGFSGSFPNSDGLPDFADNLFNKVDLISDDNRRWTIGKKLNIVYIINYLPMIKYYNIVDLSNIPVYYFRSPGNPTANWKTESSK